MEKHDLAGLVEKICASIDPKGQVPAAKASALASLDQAKLQTAKDGLCTAGLAKAAAAGCNGCPPSYYHVLTGRDICQELESNEEILGKAAGTDFNNARAACEREGFRGGASGLSAIALNAINGFADFLKARAKQELVLYAVERFGRTLCVGAKAQQEKDEKKAQENKAKNKAENNAENNAENKDEVSENEEAEKTEVSSPTRCPASKPPPLSGLELFPKGCNTLFPDGAEHEFDYEALTSGPVELSFHDDLRALPATFLKRQSIRVGNPAQCQGWGVLLDTATKGIVDTPRGRKPLDFFRDVAEELDLWRSEEGKSLEDLGLLCDLKEQHPSLPCVALLLAEVGREGSLQYEASPSPSLSSWLENATKSYCSRYGKPKEPDAACVIGADYPRAWHVHLERFARTIQQLAEAQEALRAQWKSGTATKDSQEQLLAGIMRAIEASFEVYSDVLQAKGDRESAQKVEAFRAGTRVARALAEKDRAGVQAGLTDLVNSAPGILPPGLQKSARFASALAATNTREEAKQVIEEAAAPVGSYRLKFRPEHRTGVTLNAFVGPFVARQFNLNRASNAEVDKQDTVTRLAAPVGVDFTFWHPCQGRHNVAAGISAIDPLAFVSAQSDGGDVDHKWRAVLAPGAYVRWGIGRSPFVLMLGWVYQPGVRSKELCGDESCWRGAHQVGLSLSVDIPLLVVR